MKKQYCYICNKRIYKTPDQINKYNLHLLCIHDNQIDINWILCDKCINNIENYIEKQKTKYTKNYQKTKNKRTNGLKAKIWKNKKPI